MIAGALVKIPDEQPIEELNNVVWGRSSGGFPLRSLIQFRPSLGGQSPDIQEALAIHQEVRREWTIDEKDGVYSIVPQDVVSTIWANIYIVQGLVIVDRTDNRGFVLDIINNGLGRECAHQVFLDSKAMARDHSDQWMRGFSERRGRVDTGVLYGEGVEQDDVFGPELDRSASQSVGWITRSFGEPTKVRVSPAGSVVVWSWPRIEQFIDFLRREVIIYMISL